MGDCARSCWCKLMGTPFFAERAFVIHAAKEPWETRNGADRRTNVVAVRGSPFGVPKSSGLESDSFMGGSLSWTRLSLAQSFHASDLSQTTWRRGESNLCFLPAMSSNIRGCFARAI